ncbi:hypothetical protein AX14_000907 [Amanita brunnescens Koide BX004]|nr:hypothetical protein AX14_000907 [Amanita brunnescens Koide BX004]
MRKKWMDRVLELLISPTPANVVEPTLGHLRPSPPSPQEDEEKIIKDPQSPSSSPSPAFAEEAELPLQDDTTGETSPRVKMKMSLKDFAMRRIRKTEGKRWCLYCLQRVLIRGKPSKKRSNRRPQKSEISSTSAGSSIPPPPMIKSGAWVIAYTAHSTKVV